MTHTASAQSTRRPHAALILAAIALVLAMSGAAVALPGKNKVDKNDIRKNAVVSKAIKGGAVTNSKLSSNAVTSSKLADGAVTNTKLVDGVVTEAKLATGAVTRDRIKASAVTKQKLADQSVDATKLADGAVTDAKVANLQFTPVTLSNGYVPKGAGFATPSFAIDVEGIVHLRGAATQPSGPTAALGVLPDAARPANPVFAAGFCDGTTLVPAMLSVAINGAISATAAQPADQAVCEDTGFVSLDSLSFPAGG
jgi:trimeric autotransporter adhesin